MIIQYLNNMNNTYDNMCTWHIMYISAYMHDHSCIWYITVIWITRWQKGFCLKVSFWLNNNILTPILFHLMVGGTNRLRIMEIHRVWIYFDLLRERPFDFQGGGGVLEKNILALIFVKKNILASTQTKKNSLTLGMRKKITALLRDKKNQLSIWWTKILPP